MNRLSALKNENGSALLVAIILVPMVTLVCVFASNIVYQDTTVSTNDECLRDGFYDADAAVYATAKLISRVINTKHKSRTAVKTGAGEAAEGADYLNSDSDKAEGFKTGTVVGPKLVPGDDVQFIKSDPVNDIGIEATVSVDKFKTGAPAGSAAEFGMGGDGAGASIPAVTYRMDSQGQLPCGDPANPVQTPVRGHYLMIPHYVSPKGI